MWFLSLYFKYLIWNVWSCREWKVMNSPVYDSHRDKIIKKCQVKKLFIVPLLIYQKAEYVKWKCMNMKKKPAVN